MKRIVVVFAFLIFVIKGFSEVVVISSFKGYSHFYEKNTLFFSDVLLEVSGGNKYGGSIVLTPISVNFFSNINVKVEKIEFFVNVLNFVKVSYWYGNKEYLGYVSSFQGRFYQTDPMFDFRGWYIIDGTGISFDVSFFDDALGISSYFYRDFLTTNSIGNFALKLTGKYRDLMLSVFSSLYEEGVRCGLEFRTMFRFLNFSAVVGVQNIYFTNLNIEPTKIYSLIEERLNFISADYSWGFEQIMTFLLKPSVFRGIEKPTEISDVDVRLLIGLSFLKNIVIGSEGILSLYGLFLPISQLGVSSDVGVFLGFEDNNILIKLQPMFRVFSSLTNDSNWFRLSISGELRF